jgi:hypothetical protein
LQCGDGLKGSTESIPRQEHRLIVFARRERASFAPARFFFYPLLSAALTIRFTVSTQSPDDGMFPFREVLILHGAGGGRYTPKRFWCSEHISHAGAFQWTCHQGKPPGEAREEHGRSRLIAIRTIATWRLSLMQNLPV